MDEKKRILIVDDEEIIRDILFDLFRDEGFEPLVACSAEDALDLAPRAHCIILDRKLSIQSDDDGGEVLRTLWADEQFDTPVIIFSGYLYSNELDEQLKHIEQSAGRGRTIAQCVPKSGGFKNLVSVVNSCLAKRES